MKYIVKDNIHKTYLCYDEYNLTSDHWTIYRICATKYSSLADAKKAKRFFAKICKIKLKDISIDEAKI